jgi:hypothetical protein
MKLHTINKKKPTKEFMGRKGKSAEEKGKEHHPSSCNTPLPWWIDCNFENQSHNPRHTLYQWINIHHELSTTCVVDIFPISNHADVGVYPYDKS